MTMFLFAISPDRVMFATLVILCSADHLASGKLLVFVLLFRCLRRVIGVRYRITKAHPHSGQFILELTINPSISALCPPGKYTDASGASSAQPLCKPCATGFFKFATSTSNTETDSCTVHTRCPPGKHTIVSGSATSQPQCEACAAGFYKGITSKSSTCVGKPGRFVLFYIQTLL